MFIFCLSQHGSGLPLWTPHLPAGMPPIWIFTGQDISIVPSYLKPPDKVQVSWKALELVKKTYPKKNMTLHIKQHNTGRDKTGRVSRASWRSQKRPAANSQSTFVPQFPPSVRKDISTSCDVGVQLLYGSAWLQTGGATEKWSTNHQTSNQRKLIQQTLGFKPTS